MSLTGVAALIAAVSFAVLACAVTYLAVRFTRVLGDAATLVRETRTSQQALFTRANAAIDRADEPAFSAALSALLAQVREHGEVVPPEHLGPSELILPHEGSSMDEVRKMLTDEGLISG